MCKNRARRGCTRRASCTRRRMKTLATRMEVVGGGRRGGRRRLLLLIAQDQETIRVAEPVAATDDRFPGLRRLAGRRVRSNRGDRYTVLRNGDEVFPAMLDAIRQATIAHQLRELHLRGRRRRRPVHRGAASRPRGAASRCASCSMRSAASCRRDSQKKLTDAGVIAGLVQPGAAVDARGNELPHAPQGARRRRLGRVHRRHRPRRSLAGQRRRRGALARHAVQGHRARRARARGVVLRELARVGRQVGARARSRAARRRTPARARSSSGAIRPAAPATSSCCTCCRSPARASTIDIQSPYVILDESTRWSLDEARAARRARPHSHRRRDHRRQAGEVSRAAKDTRRCSRTASRSSNISRR